ncbi:hypothetical protein D5F01_LYC19165 [Larimichthys crocea]|uniref:Uncharacterized protein n=1 Tax=Larimichthys crocea TaxID=215358 RepID=A0A6G0HRZ1_LARCR|nr:hypothetical protein D5F01_LYC19165 [Larimichthys crocea]
MLKAELTLPLHCLVMWTDPTTILTWLQSESCQYKIFVAHRITEILEHTAASGWSVSPNLLQFQCWEDLVVRTSQHISPSLDADPQAPDKPYVETLLLQHAQQESFPEEFALLQANKPILKQSPLNNLAPEFDHTTNLIRVGGWLRKSEDLDYSNMHPVVLDPKNYITQLLIKDHDKRLKHPGPEFMY